MAGISKPNVDSLGKEAKYTVLSCKDRGGSTPSNCGLFDGTTNGAWDSSKIFYWQESPHYLEIEILSYRVNIWRSGNNYGHHSELTIEKWDGEKYIDVTKIYPQVLTSITNLELEKTICNLPKGKYKFIRNNGYRLDAEWHIEEIKSIKYLIQDKNNILYTLNGVNLVQAPSQILDENNLIDNGLTDTDLITKDLLLSKFENLEGIKLLVYTDDLEKKECEMIYNCEPFRPIDKLKKNSDICNILFKEV